MLFTPESMGKYRPHYKKTLAVVRGILERGYVKGERDRGALLALIKREEVTRDDKP